MCNFHKYLSVIAIYTETVRAIAILNDYLSIYSATTITGAT